MSWSARKPPSRINQNPAREARRLRRPPPLLLLRPRPERRRMAISKSKKPPSPDDDIDALKSDVASFASSIGLSSALSPDSGFNDSDFRKKGPLNPQSPPPQLHGRRDSASKNNKKPPPPPRQQQQQQQQQQQKKGKGSGFGVFEGGGGKSFQLKYKHLPKLPLMRANDLSGQWYSDLADLEGRVLAESAKIVGASDLEVVKQLAMEKRDLAERLLEQFSQDYEGSRAKALDMKMVAAAQRSGTATDKVAAFTCLVEDNPIANLRSLDALLGSFFFSPQFSSTV